MSVHNLTGKASRSGKQHTYTGEGYDSWSGLSPNGRQVKNELTGESRDLSGADYWHARKAIKPESIGDAPPTWVNGKPNIRAFGFAEEPTKASKKNKLPPEKEAEYKVFPQQRTLDRVEGLIEDLEKRADSLDSDTYLEQRQALDTRRDRAWKNLCKAKGWQITDEAEEPRAALQARDEGEETFSRGPNWWEMNRYTIQKYLLTAAKVGASVAFIRYMIS